jgi:hypothetical protein
MIQEITLRPAIENYKTTTRFTGKYFDTDKRVHTVILDLGGGRYSVIYDREVTATERQLTKWFGENQRDITIRWDDSDRKTNEAVDAIQRHPQVHTEGYTNPNRQGTPQFEFIDKRKQTALKVSKLKEKAAVFSLVNNMDVQEMMDICFFVGHNPVGKTFEDSFVTLLDYTDGILMRNPAQFLNDWQSPDKSITVIVRKAIDLKIISTKEGKFYVNTEIVGDSYEGVISYMKVNDNLYDFVKRNVAERDTLPLDVNKGNAKVSAVSPDVKELPSKKAKPLGDRADEKTAKEKANVEEFDERVKLKAEMKSLGIPGYQVSDAWTIDKIKQKITAKRTELAGATA